MAAADFTTGLKYCPKCDKTKGIGEFGKSGSRPDGLQVWCRKCKREAGIEYEKKNKERLRPIRKAWALRNPDKVRARSLRFQTKWRLRDPIGFYAYYKKYRPPEVERQYNQAKYWKDPEKTRAGARARYAANVDHARDLARKYARQNPERVRAGSISYKARKRGAEGRHTGADIKRLFKLQKGKCAYFWFCHTSIKKKYHVDHIIALADGGTNWPWNLQLTCPRCNMMKHRMSPHAFAKRIGLLI